MPRGIFSLRAFLQQVSRDARNLKPVERTENLATPPAGGLLRSKNPDLRSSEIPVLQGGEDVNGVPSLLTGDRIVFRVFSDEKIEQTPRGRA